jgi:hypothetical protein
MRIKSVFDESDTGSPLRPDRQQNYPLRNTNISKLARSHKIDQRRLPSGFDFFIYSARSNAYQQFWRAKRGRES